MKRQVYIIGSKGIPANYGGFETFVEKLTQYQASQEIHYNVFCLYENSQKAHIPGEYFSHNQATCINIAVPSIGPAKAVYYDFKALAYGIRLAEEHHDKHPIFYVLTCRIGPFIGFFKRKIEKLGGKLYINPDGHEWLRAKWSYPVKRYWKLSERLMIKHGDLIICDSKKIESYIKERYARYHPKTEYIAYGTETATSTLSYTDAQVNEWFQKQKISENDYYLVVGRFVPENNYRAIIQAFMKSTTKKKLMLVTNVAENAFFKELKAETQFHLDSRIRFVGTVYDQELLKYIRENAFAYIHGHEVGGTNPSLLEALAMTKLNLLLGVPFNREVAENGALYWEKDNLAVQIAVAEGLDQATIGQLHAASALRIQEQYTWPKIVNQYETLLTE